MHLIGMQSGRKYKIAFLIPYPLGVAPGQRFRFEQYISFLNEQGYETAFFPFIDNNLNSLLYVRGHFFKKTYYLVLSYLKRFIDIYRVKDFDGVYLFRESCFLGPPVFEYIVLKIYKKKLIFDFDDAIWLPNSSEANKMWSWLKFTNKTIFFLKNASAVTAGNNYLADYAKAFSDNVSVIPTTIDMSYHSYTKPHTKKQKVVIGWTGSETTIRYFEQEKDMILNLLNKYSDLIEFRVISNKPSSLNHPGVTFVKWKKETEVQDVLEFDIGIMPLPNDDWAKGKCGFKGLQYMSLGIPAVVSPVGVNTDIIVNEVNGFFADSTTGWEDALSRLIDDFQLRERIGREGKKTIEKFYSVNSQKNKYADIFKNTFIGNNGVIS